MTMIVAVAMTTTALSQNPATNGNWIETGNWMSASEKITDKKIDARFIFDLTADAETVYTSEDGMMIVTEYSGSDVVTWIGDMQEGIFESGDTYFNLSTDVKAMDGMGYSAYYHGMIEGEPIMMQRFLYVDNNGLSYEAKVFNKTFDQWNDANSATYFIANLMETPAPSYAFANE